MTATNRVGQRILAVGPLPPPLAGTSISFKLFCDIAEAHPAGVTVDVVNSAPKELGQKRLLTFGHFATAGRTVRRYVKGIRRADRVVVFGSNQFLAALVPVFVCIAKLAGKPCYVRSFGGSLDIYYRRMRPRYRAFFRWVLRRSDGLIVQTRLLKDFFDDELGEKVYLVAGYRSLDADGHTGDGDRDSGDELRLVYLSHVREEKGVFDLLESLRILRAEGRFPIRCDIYGPVYSDTASRFERAIADTPDAEYRGVLQPHEVMPALRRYDALVFPSYYEGEGHPGVLIEAIVSGTPVVATDFRSIPEVVEHGVNGMLVKPRSPRELADTFRLLLDDRERLRSMSARCLARRETYSAAHVVPGLLAIVGVGPSPPGAGTRSLSTEAGTTDVTTH